MGFNTSSVWIKVALICLLLATVLFVIGFATVSWMGYDIRGLYNSADYGLWKWNFCTHRSCQTYSITTSELTRRGWEDWYRATQAFECIGLICLCLATFVMLLFVFMDKMRKRSPLIAVIVLSLAAVVCMVIGFVIFGTKFENYNVGWSMGVAIAGCVLTFVAFVMALIDLKK